MVNKLTTQIQSAAWEVSEPDETYNLKNNYPMVSDKIHSLIVEKRRARAKCQTTRLLYHKSIYNNIANALKKPLQNINHTHSLTGAYGEKPSNHLNIKPLHLH